MSGSRYGNGADLARELNITAESLREAEKAGRIVRADPDPGNAADAKAPRAFVLLRMELAGARLQVARAVLAIRRRDLVAADRFGIDAQVALNRAEEYGDLLARQFAAGARDGA